jgi:3-oxoacyl-[acyl-carrier protein] reductase
MNFELGNKRCLITGASQGIGAAIAERFLDENANIMIVSRGSEKLFATKGLLQSQYGENKIESAICDCTDKASLDSLKETILQRWGGVDFVISNVGDGRSVPDPLPGEEQWNKTWNNNFESALQTARVFLPMLQKSKGCLLFVSSIAGMEAFGAPVDYSTAKTAVTALAKNMARKLGGEVRVNVLAPGNIYFPGGSWDEKIKQDSERVNKMIESTVPMNRFGTPDEIADAAVFLCSERASFITGSVLVVDGGQTVGVL